MAQQEFPLVDTIGMEMLMHRDAHFGANFDIMLEYYEQNGIGVMPDFTTEAIRKLQQLEEEVHQDLSTAYLPTSAKEQVDCSQKMYQQLQTVYAQDSPGPIDILINNLILSEEEDPKKEIEAVVERGEEIVVPLIHLLEKDVLYDPLFPGYGRGPILAARCLALIQEPSAIQPLFEALVHENFFTDEGIIRALCAFGESAKSFLLDTLVQTPFSKKNEYAAMALGAFPIDENIMATSLQLLENPKNWGRCNLSIYLIYLCSNLIDSDDRQRFFNLTHHRELPQLLREEILTITHIWNNY